MELHTLIFNLYFFGAAILLGFVHGYFTLPLNRKILSENMPEVGRQIVEEQEKAGYGFFFDRALILGNIKGIKGVRENRRKWYLSLMFMAAWYLVSFFMLASVLMLVFSNA